MQNTCPFPFCCQKCLHLVRARTDFAEREELCPCHETSWKRLALPPVNITVGGLGEVLRHGQLWNCPPEWSLWWKLCIHAGTEKKGQCYMSHFKALARLGTAFCADESSAAASAAHWPTHLHRLQPSCSPKLALRTVVFIAAGSQSVWQGC